MSSHLSLGPYKKAIRSFKRACFTQAGDAEILTHSHVIRTEASPDFLAHTREHASRPGKRSLTSIVK